MNFSKKTTNIIAWVISGLLGALYLLSGTPKILQQEGVIQMFADWGYPVWFAITIGILEVTGGILLFIRPVAMYSGLMLVVLMLGAAYTHISNGEGLEVIRPIIFIVLLGIVIFIRRKN